MLAEGLVKKKKVDLRVVQEEGEGEIALTEFFTQYPNNPNISNVVRVFLRFAQLLLQQMYTDLV